MANRLDIDVLEMGMAVRREWDYRGFVADPFFRLYCVTEGMTELLFPEGIFTLRQGNVYLIPANVPFRYVSREFLCHHWLHFCSSFLERHPHFQKPLSISSASSPQAIALLEELYALAARVGGIGTIMRMDIIVRELLTPFLAEMVVECPSGRMEGYDIFTPVIDYIDRHIGDEVTVPKLAAFLNMKRNTFSAAFHQTFGVPPKQYMTRRRIDRSKMLLIRTNLSIKEIASQMGFNNEFFYSRIFKKYVQMPPVEYRRSRNICL